MSSILPALVHEAVEEASLIVRYHQLVPFLRLQSQALQGVVLDKGESKSNKCLNIPDWTSLLQCLPFIRTFTHLDP